MQTKQLNIFVTVADCQGVSKASERLFLSPSSITYQIQQLEKELGVTLFDRTIKNMTLTRTGRIVYDYAVKALAEESNLVFQAQRYDRISANSIWLGHHNTHSDPYLPGYLASLHMNSGGRLPITLEVDSSASILGKVLDGSLDAGIVLERELSERSLLNTENANIGITRLFASTSYFIARKEIFPESMEKAYLSDLGDYPLITPDDSAPLDIVPWAKELSKEKVIIPSTFDVAIAYAVAGIGVLVVPNEIVFLPPSLRQVPFVEGSSLAWKLLVWRKNNEKQALAPFLEQITSYYQAQRSGH